MNKTTRVANPRLLIYNALKEGLNPIGISRRFNINKKTVQNHLTTLKREGLVKKIGYGTWEIDNKTSLRSLEKTTRLAHITKTSLEKTKTSFLPDSVRGHAFEFVFEIPKDFRNWDKRRELLQKQGISFKELKIFGGGEQLEFKGRKIWLTNKSIIIFEKSSYFAETSKESKSKAISDVLELIKSFGNHIKANIPINRFRVAKQHYALIKNELAKQYNQEGKKLYISNNSGFWFQIDNSFNLNEAETLHPKTADLDNKPVQDFFNSLKDYPITSKVILEFVRDVTGNQAVFDKNMTSHLDVLDRLGKAVDKLTEKIKELGEKK